MQKEILLSYFPKITPKRYQQLVAVFSSLDKVWEAKFEDFKTMGWDDELIHEFLDWKKELDEDKTERILKQEHIKTITLNDPEYPKLLKEIYDPPFCLFVRGELNQDDFSLAVVGTRKYTPYGKQITQELVRELAMQGLTIISGLAFGIDSIGHQATLDAGGKTMAVLGSGINRQHIYPAAHKNLAERIIQNGGAIISEYPPGALPTKYSFPRRNRIIAGLSLGVLIIEAGEKSGALITGRCTLDYGREVFTVPQNITSPTSVGPNNLIKMGAHPVTSATDILEILNLQEIKQYLDNKKIIPDSDNEAKLLPHLSREPIHIDHLIKKSELDSSVINSTLTLMEMKGKVKNLGGMMYVIGR